VKTDLNHPNPAIRDWPALRIINTQKYPHPRVGSRYRVWPLYNFACGLDDHLMGVTHIIRGKEHLTNKLRQEYMYKHLGWEYPEAIHYGRLKISGTSLSKSKIVKGVVEGFFKGWDDPRLATFLALRKRGISPEAIRQMMIEIGPKKADIVLSWENLYAFNRKFLDPKVLRYFFVHEPLELKVNNVPEIFITKLPLHPNDPRRGFRKYVIKPTGENKTAAFWVSKKDLDNLRPGDLFRLMELFNIKVESTNACSAKSSFVSESYEEARTAKAKLIHWIPIGEGIPCKVVMPNMALAEGIAERACKKLKLGSVIQFERFGFVRIVKLNMKLIAYFAHK
jgi:glutamyl-tRNA synthetase